MHISRVANPLRLRLHLPRLQMRSPFSNEGRLVLFRTQSGGSVVFNFTSSDEIMRALLPTINDAFTQQFLTVARNTAANLPLSDVFKPWEEPPAHWVPRQ
ncbi:hypothetical protein B566_EDAN001831 [Ephemera danica]|nr:hypothetical protein B566_EDAN001831 [Ephemera danica]